MGSFISHYGKFLGVSACRDCLVAASSSNGVKEQFRILLTPNQTVSFRSTHGKYLVAEGDRKTVKANRNEASLWEKWSTIENGNRTALKSYHGLFMSADTKGSLVADRASPDAWERFSIILKDGGMGLLSVHGTFVSADPHGRVVSDRGEMNDWENFAVKMY